MYFLKKRHQGKNHICWVSLPNQHKMCTHNFTVKSASLKLLLSTGKILWLSSDAENTLLKDVCLSCSFESSYFWALPLIKTQQGLSSAFWMAVVKLMLKKLHWIFHFNIMQLINSNGITKNKISVSSARDFSSSSERNGFRVVAKLHLSWMNQHSKKGCFFFD